jgi:hypothetical protein
MQNFINTLEDNGLYVFASQALLLFRTYREGFAYH